MDHRLLVHRVVVLMILVLMSTGCDEGSPTEPILLADFTYDAVGLAVEFNDTSQGPVITWFWEFGDQTASTFRSPSHEFPRAGTYNVRLTVCRTDQPGPTGDCDTRERLVTVISKD